MKKPRQARHAELDCIYCTKSRGTREHVVPRSWFEDPPPPNLITAPCCEACNTSFRADQEATRAELVQRRPPQPHREREHVHAKVMRGFDKGYRQPMANLLRTLRWTPVPRENSPILGVKAEFTPDFPCMERVVARMVRGLFYHQNKRPLAPQYAAVSVHIANLPGTEETGGRGIDRSLGELIQMLVRAPYHAKGENFGYRFLSGGDEPDHTAWLVRLFGFEFFLGATLESSIIPPETPCY